MKLALLFALALFWSDKNCVKYGKQNGASIVCRTSASVHGDLEIGVRWSRNRDPAHYVLFLGTRHDVGHQCYTCYVSPAWAHWSGFGTGTAKFRIRMPHDHALIGLKFAAQFILIRPVRAPTCRDLFWTEGAEYTVKD